MEDMIIFGCIHILLSFVTEDVTGILQAGEVVLVTKTPRHGVVWKITTTQWWKSLLKYCTDLRYLKTSMLRYFEHLQ